MINLLASLGRAVLALLLWIGQTVLAALIWITYPFVALLAHLHLFCFHMEEGTMRVILRGAERVEGPHTGELITKGALQRVEIQWEGHTLSQISGTDSGGNRVDRWQVVPEGTLVNGQVQEEPWHPWGSIRFYWWPLETVHRYEFNWTSVETGGHPQPHDWEVLDYVFAKEDIYFAEIFTAEDQSGLPLYVSFLTRARVINAKKALFDIQNWLEAVLNRERTLIRGYIANERYREVKAKQTEAAGEVWEDLSATGRIEEFFLDYGVEVPEGGIDFLDIDPPEEYRDTTLVEFREQEQRRGIRQRAAADRERIDMLGAKGLVGRVIDGFARRIGGEGGD